MPNLNDKIYLVVMIMGCIALAISGCGSQRANDIKPIEAESQSVAATMTPTPATEIAEPGAPVSPISPILPTKEAGSMAAKPIQGSEKALAAAIADLATQTDVPAEEIILVSMEAVDWSDSSLGCPQEGFMYAQVITPGYLIELEAAGEPFEYHTDLEGNSVVLCKIQ
jgi:hypothetical protein